MDLLTRDELKALLEYQSDPAVSLFIPTHRGGAEYQQDMLRFKNMLTQAEERLIAYGLRSPTARKLLEPAQDFAEDEMFWQRQGDGLVLFVAEDMFRYYSLPLDFEELLVVTDRFHIKPLLPIFSQNGRFYVLALSQNNIRLLQGTRYRVQEITLGDEVPTSLEEALRFDDPEKEQQFHTGTTQQRGDRRAIFFGHGGDAYLDKKANIHRYFQHVNKGLQNILQHEKAPLVLAGVEYLHPIFKETSSYPNLLDEGIKGNPDNLEPEELHQAGWNIAENYFEQARQQAVDRYHMLLNRGNASKDIREIVPAAYYGRVDTLFVATGRQQWGSFDPNTNTIDLHGEAEPGDEDMLDSAAVQTLLHDGTVYALSIDNMPDGVLLAAVFRY